jgi:hypothetical protein
MKRIAGFFLGVSLTAMAQEQVPIVHLNAAPRVLTSLDAIPGRNGTLDSISLRKSGIRPEAVILETRSSILLLPVGINSPGKNGTFFRTDATIANYRMQTQLIGIAWLPLGVPSAGAALQYFNLAPNTIYLISDYLASGSGRLGETGVGSVVIYGLITDTNTVDSGAMLDASFRIWTFEPGSSGTNSFTVDSTSGEVKGSARATALGLRQDDGFRTNVGIVNLDNVSHTWSVRVAGGLITEQTTFPVTVPAYSMIQTAIPAGSFGIMFIDFNPEPGSYLWNAYGVTADNITGDAWLARAAQ